MDITAKIKELAQKYDIPPQLLKEAMALEVAKNYSKKSAAIT
jgi:hypothetical protein